MVDRKTGASIGVNKELSFIDISKLNMLYPCENIDSLCGEFSFSGRKQSLGRRFRSKNDWFYRDKTILYLNKYKGLWKS